MELITPTVHDKILDELAIRPTVNAKILKKADRLFTGSLEGRITEVIQNARRAGATSVSISNWDGKITVQDNGTGIEDFSILLNLGGSGWDEATEVSEDPAGIGLFSLAPREVTIRSKGKIVTISGDGWVSAPSVVRDDPRPVLQGTVLEFQDDPWDYQTVNRLVRFSCVTVYVNNVRCDKEDFIQGEAVHHLPDLGCRIQIVGQSHQIPANIRASAALPRRVSWYGATCVLNFHGQVVAWEAKSIPDNLCCLVDLTGQPTGLRLLLPARTEVVENAAFKELEAAIIKAAFQFLKYRGRHSLPYSEFLRARALGIDLPEATPEYHEGTLCEGEGPAPVDIPRKDRKKMVPLSQSYRMPAEMEYDGEWTNAHLLAALGEFPQDARFVPVVINKEYDGYSWADAVPLVRGVSVEASDEVIFSDYVGSGTISLVESITITAKTSDGKTFSSPVCMALDHEEHLLVTQEARTAIAASEAWYHLGGYYDDGDTYDSQAYSFEKDWERFWADAAGPHEHLRQEVTQLLLFQLKGWKEVRVTPDGAVKVIKDDDSEMTISPPPMQKAA